MTRNTFKAGGMILCAGLALAAFASDAPARLQGEWSLNNWTSGDSVRLKLGYRNGATRWSWSSDQPIADLSGLTREQLHDAHANVKFKLVRDPGTFAFDGAIVLGFGGGDYEFVPDPTFRASLSALGFDASGEDGRALMMMATRDISLAFAAEVARLGFRDPAVLDLVQLRDHGVDVEFIRKLAAMGKTGLTAGDVVRLHDHGIDAPYLARIQSSGFDGLTVDQIIRLHDHGVD